VLHALFCSRHCRWSHSGSQEEGPWIGHVRRRPGLCSTSGIMACFPHLAVGFTPVTTPALYHAPPGKRPFETILSLLAAPARAAFRRTRGSNVETIAISCSCLVTVHLVHLFIASFSDHMGVPRVFPLPFKAAYRPLLDFAQERAVFERTFPLHLTCHATEGDRDHSMYEPKRKRARVGRPRSGPPTSTAGDLYGLFSIPSQSLELTVYD